MEVGTIKAFFNFSDVIFVRVRSCDRAFDAVTLNDGYFVEQEEVDACDAKRVAFFAEDIKWCGAEAPSGNGVFDHEK